MTEKKTTRNQTLICNIILMAVVVIAIVILNRLFTLSCDDMTYSLADHPGILASVKESLMQGNGRLLGNFFGYIVSYKTFTLLEKTLLWSEIVFLVMKIVGSESLVLNSAIAVIMIYPCDSIFSQVYSWNAGFQNYAFPVFIILFDILLFKVANTAESKHKKLFAVILLAISSFAGHFFGKLLRICMLPCRMHTDFIRCTKEIRSSDNSVYCVNRNRACDDVDLSLCFGNEHQDFRI